MSIKAVLFDLDGTLLPMDNDEMVKDYFSRMCAYMAEYGYEKKAFAGALFAGLHAMISNSGEVNNESAFWKAFKFAAGEPSDIQLQAFEKFYVNEFDKIRAVCGFSSDSAEIVKELKLRGIKVVIATQPAFPRIATEKRILWSGVDICDVDYFTTYENSHYCKPKAEYYEEILKALSLRADECVMVGNDAKEDMSAENIGMKVFLLTDYLINKDNADISRYPRGSFSELREFLSLN